MRLEHPELSSRAWCAACAGGTGTKQRLPDMCHVCAALCLENGVNHHLKNQVGRASANAVFHFTSSCVANTTSHFALQVWQPDPDKPALKIVWNPFGTLLCLFYLAATVYYFYVRFAFTMALGKTSWCVYVSTVRTLTTTRYRGALRDHRRLH